MKVATAQELGRACSPDDALAVAVQLFELDEYASIPERHKGRPDWPVRRWEDLSPDLRWHYWRRGQQAVDRYDDERLRAAA